jgi:hypothetical protein
MKEHNWHFVAAAQGDIASLIAVCANRDCGLVRATAAYLNANQFIDLSGSCPAKAGKSAPLPKMPTFVPADDD